MPLDRSRLFVGEHDTAATAALLGRWRLRDRGGEALCSEPDGVTSTSLFALGVPFAFALGVPFAFGGCGTVCACRAPAAFTFTGSGLAECPGSGFSPGANSDSESEPELEVELTILGGLFRDPPNVAATAAPPLQEDMLAGAARSRWNARATRCLSHARG